MERNEIIGRVLSEQRNRAANEAAEFQVLLIEAQNRIAELTTENETLRAQISGGQDE